MALLRRQLVPEIMDQPDLSPQRHHQALTGLARINAVSFAAQTMFRALSRFQDESKLSRLRILDIASGAGDTAIRLQRLASQAGRDWVVSGCDKSEVAIEHARKCALEAGIVVNFFCHDLFAAPPNASVPDGYDVVTCSLFVHHLTEEEAVALLADLAKPTRTEPRLVLVFDLDRSIIGLLLAQIIPRFLTRSNVVHIDGPRSVHAAFTRAEALALAQKAGLFGVSIRRAWPFRWLLTWRRP